MGKIGCFISRKSFNGAIWVWFGVLLDLFQWPLAQPNYIAPMSEMGFKTNYPALIVYRIVLVGGQWTIIVTRPRY